MRRHYYFGLKALFLAAFCGVVVQCSNANKVVDHFGEDGGHIAMGRVSRAGNRNSTKQISSNNNSDKPQKLTAGAHQVGCSNIFQCSYVDRFAWRDGSRWTWADGWSNGKGFDAWWSQSRVQYWGNRMRISIAKQPRMDKNYASGQQQSKGWHGYGCYEVRMKPVKQRGLVSTFFAYTGFWDHAPGYPKKHQEIDVEFVWKENRGEFLMQCNYFVAGRGGNEKYINLPFKMWEEFHNYAFKWTPTKIEWYVDGRKVHIARKNIPKAWNGPLKIMMNFWPVSDRLRRWAGKFTWMGPKTVEYEAMRFTKGADCTIQNSF